jgi:2-keto-4-pentenoate hydratase
VRRSGDVAAAQSADGVDAVHAARATQLAELERVVAAGHRLVGFKTALLDPAAQARLGSPGPVWGWFTDDMQLPDGGVLDLGSRHRFRAEAEIVFVLGHDLVGPGLTEADVLNATAGIRGGIELPGSRRADPPATADEFVADNTSAAHFLLGRDLVPITNGDRPGNADEQLGRIAELAGSLRCDGEVVASGTAVRVLGNTARAVAWLANALAADRLELHAGMFVFTGAVAGPISLVPGHSYAADFDRLGALTFTT